MKKEHVAGQKKAGDIMMYALSTCIWCRRTKEFLDRLGVEYYYADVDMLEGEDREKAEAEIEKWNPAGSFPTIVLNNSECVVGYKPEDLKAKLGL